MLFFLWLGSVAVAWVIGAYAAGRAQVEDSSDVVGGALFLGATWPVFLALAIIAAPFWCIYRLGQRQALRARLRPPKTIENLLDEERRR